MKRIRLMYVHRLPIHRSLYVCASARCRAHKHLHAPQCAEPSREASCSARCLSSHRTRTNSNISTSSVSTVHRQLQHISHATTGKQHHSSYTCLIARLTLALTVLHHATSFFLENNRPTTLQCRLRLSKLKCKCKWKAHRNQSVSGNLQVVMECNDNGRRICSLGVDQYVSTANADITKQACTMYHQTNISVL